MLWNQYLNVILKWCFLFVWDILFSQPQLTSVAHVASLTSLNNSEPCHPEVCGSCLGTTGIHIYLRGGKKSLTGDYRQRQMTFHCFFLDLNFVINYFCSYVWALLLFFSGLSPDFYWFDLKWKFSSDLKSSHCTLSKAQW